MSSKPSNSSKSTDLIEAVREFALAAGFHAPVSVAPLQGGMSAKLFLVESGEQRAVARIPSDYMATLVADPVRYEAATLRAIAIPALVTPQVLAHDDHMLLLSYCPGQPTAQPDSQPHYFEQFARCLAKIHDAPTAGLEHLLPMKLPYVPRSQPWRTDLPEHEMVQALQSLPPPTLEPKVLRHGDFWPGNVLWQHGQVSAVIDWENALLGPAVADLAITQLDMWWMGGESAMAAFTNEYLRLRPTPLDDLRYWQIRAALRPMENIEEWAAPYASLGRPDITAESVVAGLREFVENGCGLSFSAFGDEEGGCC